MSSCSLEEELDKCLPYVLDAGYSVRSFWDLTYGEIRLVIEALNRKRKDDFTKSYTIANLTASFVGLMMDGKPIPKLDSFLKDTVSQEELEARKLKQIEAQLYDFAMRRNKKIKEAQLNGR